MINPYTFTIITICLFFIVLILYTKDFVLYKRYKIFNEKYNSCLADIDNYLIFENLFFREKINEHLYFIYKLDFNKNVVDKIEDVISNNTFSGFIERLINLDIYIRLKYGQEFVQDIIANKYKSFNIYNQTDLDLMSKKDWIIINKIYPYFYLFPIIQHILRYNNEYRKIILEYVRSKS